MINRRGALLDGESLIMFWNGVKIRRQKNEIIFNYTMFFLLEYIIVYLFHDKCILLVVLFFFKIFILLKRYNIYKFVYM